MYQFQKYGAKEHIFIHVCKYFLIKNTFVCTKHIKVCNYIEI